MKAVISCTENSLLPPVKEESALKLISFFFPEGMTYILLLINEDKDFLDTPGREALSFA